MRRATLTVAALLGAAVIVLSFTLPPRPLEIPLAGVDPDLLRRTVRGAFHVHTTRSDGAGSRAEVAAAAARAGLQFVIFTDHGDGTGPPHAPEYLDGVLCLDAVEVSTNGGHYVAFDMPAAPYPLGGEAAAVAEDVSRLGGFGVAAHPDHPRAELAWQDWTVPIDGIEWINLDSEWRDESMLALARVPFDYLWRPAPAIGSLLDRPVRTLDRWDALQAKRPVVALAAVDAHGAGAREGEGRAAKLGIGPGYEASFRTLSNRVLLDAPPTGDANADERRLFDAIRRGSVYSVVDVISRDAVLRGLKAPELASPLPSGARHVVIRDGGSSRLEVHFDRAPGSPPVPWVLSNWAGERTAPVAPASPEPPITQPVSVSSTWRIEKDPASSGQVAATGDTVTVQYALAESGSSPFVAAAADLGRQQSLDALVFTARADKPMRVSVQLRFADGSRWTKSAYISPEERQVIVPLRHMVAADSRGTRMPDAGTASSILFVVDLVNARRGSSGSFSVGTLRRTE